MECRLWLALIEVEVKHGRRECGVEVAKGGGPLSLSIAVVKKKTPHTTLHVTNMPDPDHPRDQLDSGIRQTPA